MKSGNERPAPEPPGHLSEALTDLDRADALREQIDREGATITSARSKLTRVHPAFRIENEMRRRFLAAWRALDLTWREQ